MVYVEAICVINSFWSLRKFNFIWQTNHVTEEHKNLEIMDDD